jgi:hypothetical protein
VFLEWRGGTNFTKRDRCGLRVARVGARDNFEERAQVTDGARQGTNDAEKAQRAGAGRKVAGGGNAAGSGLESTNAREMRGGADRAAAVAADTGHGTG